MKESFFRFSDPHITSIQYKDNPDFDPESFEDMRIDFTNHIGRSKEQNKAQVTVNMEIGDDKASPFQIRIAMRAYFEWDDCDNEELVQELLEKNAVSLLIGYIRPLVSMITSSSRFPTFNLPFIDLTGSDSSESDANS